MASRIGYFLIAGGAVLGGMIIQDGDRMFGWGEETKVAIHTERAIEARVEREIDRSIDRAQVIDVNGREIDVTPDAQRAMGEAVARLVKAEADLAVLRVRDAGADELQAADAVRDQARAEVDQLKNEIDREEQTAVLGSEAPEDLQRQIRDEIRTEIRDAVRN